MFWRCGGDNDCCNINHVNRNVFLPLCDILTWCLWLSQKPPTVPSFDSLMPHTLSKISPAMGGPTVIGRENSARRQPGKINKVEFGQKMTNKVWSERKYLSPGQPPLARTGRMRSDLKDSSSDYHLQGLKISYLWSYISHVHSKDLKDGNYQAGWQNSHQKGPWCCRSPAMSGTKENIWVTQW